MVKNGQFQLVGTQSMPTMAKRNTAIPSPSADPGNGEYQEIGTHLDMSRKMIASPSANPPSGEYQKIGTVAEMKRKPINEAWGSAYPTPMSRESSESDNNAAHHGISKRGSTQFYKKNRVRDHQSY